MLREKPIVRCACVLSQPPTMVVGILGQKSNVLIVDRYRRIYDNLFPFKRKRKLIEICRQSLDSKLASESLMSAISKLKGFVYFAESA